LWRGCKKEGKERKFRVFRGCMNSTVNNTRKKEKKNERREEEEHQGQCASIIKTLNNNKNTQ
jgi:hypothetical protein